MPNYVITDPNTGKKYKVTGKGTKAEALKKLQSQLGYGGSSEQQQPQVSQMQDIGRGAHLGAAEGVTGTLGLPDLGVQSMQKGVGWLMNKAGLTSPETEQRIQGNMQSGLGGVLSQQGLMDQYKKVAGDLPEPQTRYGQYARTAARNAPNAMFPGSKIANVLLPTAGEEGAAEIAKQVAPEWENEARLAGGFSGGMLATPGMKNVVVGKDVPKKAANTAFKNLRDAGVRVKPVGTGKIIGNMRKAASEAGIDPNVEAHKNMLQRLGIAEDMASTQNIKTWFPGTKSERVISGPMVSKALDIDEIMAIRARISEGYVIGADDNNRLLGHIKRAFDKSVDDLKPQDFAAPGGKVGKEAFDEWKHARTKWQQFRKAERMTHVHDNALNAQGANYTNAGYLTSVRQQLRAIAKDDFKKGKYFSKDEKNRILNIIRGSKEGGAASDEKIKTFENFMRELGKKWGGKGTMAGTQTVAGAGAATLAGASPELAVAGAVGANRLGQAAQNVADDIGINKFSNLRNTVVNAPTTPYGPRILPGGIARALPETYDEEMN
jgi:hypothetical protein